jgi:hypothetical protein
LGVVRPSEPPILATQPNQREHPREEEVGLPSEEDFSIDEPRDDNAEQGEATLHSDDHVWEEEDGQVSGDLEPATLAFHEEAPPLFEDHPAERDDAASGPELEELLVDEHGPSLDRGLEGFADAEEEELDESALPAMDADTDGDFELDDLLEELGFGKTGLWEIETVFGEAGALRSLHVAPEEMLLSAGDSLVTISLAGIVRVRPLPYPLDQLASVVGLTVASGANGAVKLELSGERPTLTTLLEQPAAQLVIAAGQVVARVNDRIFALSASGAEPIPGPSGVRSLAARASVLWVLTEQGKLLHGSSGFESLCELQLDAETEHTLQSGATILASSSAACLLQAGSTLLRVSRSSASVSVRLPETTPTQSLAACAVEAHGLEFLVARSHSSGCELLAPHFAAGELEALVRLDTSGQSGPVALGWDPSLRRAFIAGPFGLLTVRSFEQP